MINFFQGPTHACSGGTWGTITGNLYDQVDLSGALSGCVKKATSSLSIPLSGSTFTWDLSAGSVFTLDLPVSMSCVLKPVNVSLNSAGTIFINKPPMSAWSIDSFQSLVAGTGKMQLQGFPNGYIASSSIYTSLVYSFFVDVNGCVQKSAAFTPIDTSLSQSYARKVVEAKPIASCDYFTLESNMSGVFGRLTATPTDVTYGQGRVGSGALFNGSTSKINVSGLQASGRVQMGFWFKDANPTTSSLLCCVVADTSGHYIDIKTDGHGNLVLISPTTSSAPYPYNANDWNYLSSVTFATSNNDWYMRLNSGSFNNTSWNYTVGTAYVDAIFGAGKSSPALPNFSGSIDEIYWSRAGSDITNTSNEGWKALHKAMWNNGVGMTWPFDA
jgi:hypothetical protein